LSNLGLSGSFDIASAIQWTKSISIDANHDAHATALLRRAPAIAPAYVFARM
jgi:PHP family Zn ribbon phosphoesterase